MSALSPPVCRVCGKAHWQRDGCFGSLLRVAGSYAAGMKVKKKAAKRKKRKA